MIDLDAVKTRNLQRWNAMQVRPGRVPEADRVVRRLIGNWTQYLMISGATKVPPGVIACIHERESSGAIAHLANGDSLRARTVHVPRGIIPAPAQPPFGFAEAAVYALTICDHLGSWADWSIGGALTSLEGYNGFAYARMGRPSPYVFAGSDQYERGKYVADGEYDPEYVDQQLGCAVLLARVIAAGADTGISGVVAGDGHDHPASHPTTAKATMPADEHTTQWIQESLNKLGADPALDIDGDYGQATKRAVRLFQERQNLLDDGKCGPITCSALERELATKEDA